MSRPAGSLAAAGLRVVAVLVVVAGCGSAPPVAGAGEDATAAPRPVVGEARFPHDMHAEDLGFECAECHHETNAARLRVPHEEYFEDLWIECGICHREGEAAATPQSCAACHHDSPASTADETLSAKVVIHRSCWGCHDSGTGVEASRGCGFCHLDGAIGEVMP